MIRIRRIYEKPGPDDGFRVLIDRLWPRGLRKADAKVDLWAREAAPSTALRQWFGHRDERWEEFRRRYFEELDSPKARESVRAILERVRSGDVTILFGAKNERHNNAVAFREYLEERFPQELPRQAGVGG